MARDKQIFVRVTQEVYDWVAQQADEAGMSHGGVAAMILEEAKGQGWEIQPGRVVNLPAYVDEFLDHPETGTRRERPRRERQQKEGRRV